MNICMCEAQAGVRHAFDCPYPLYHASEQQELDWIARRDAKRASLKVNALQLDARGLSSGMICSLIKRHRTDGNLARVCDEVQQSFVQYCDDNRDQFGRWQDAWNAFAVRTHGFHDLYPVRH